MSELNHLLTEKLPAVTDRFLLDRQVANQAERTIETYAHRLKRFTDWCEQRGVDRITDLNAEVLAGYRRYLYYFINDRTGKSISVGTQCHHLIVVRNFLRWLLKHKLIPIDLSHDVELPKLPMRQLGEFLTAEELGKILNIPDITTPMGIRDRAILETFYSSAIRVSELAALCLHDIDRDRGLINIRHGKGDKARLAPVSNGTLDWLDKYIADTRPVFDRGRCGNELFLGYRGRPLSRGRVIDVVATAKRTAGVTKRGACHLLRHTAATQMMENGADLRSLQAYLGHEHLSTTEIYTHMTLGRLKDVHNRTHPTGDDQSKPSSPDE